MSKRKNPEKLPLVTDVSSTYSSGHSVTHPVESKGDVKHCHDNSHAQADREQEKKIARKRLCVVSVVCVVFMVGEILGGYFAGSLAVMTDAAHLLVDFTSFIISLLSLWLSSRPATHKLSYGWHRAEILGALLSIFTIWLVTGVLVYLAVERIISDDYTIDGTIMLITSGCAVLVNIIMAFTLHQSGHGHSHGGSSHGHSHGHSSKGQNEAINNHLDAEHNAGNHGRTTHQANASVRAAFVHVVGDLLQSLSVVVSAIIIFFKPEYKIADPICTFLFSILVLCTTFTIMRDIVIVLMEGEANASVRAAFVHVVGDLLQSLSVVVSAIIIFFKPEYKIADPICTFLFSILVLCTTFTIMRDIVIVLMEGAPAGVSYGEVREGLLAVKGVTAVHNLHIWALTMNQAVMTAHVAIDESADAQTVLSEMTQTCYSTFNFHSVTIQMERQADLKPGCTLCEDPRK
ncbi:zinc transporter 8 [Cynoglossus semilaevis]|uniref:zinc transporter 8 n=1 Tax=Cynoglossus semilaevis TaxID=244447 RepID=UPI000D62893D|nr:zinc transporter 8 [Cynoglossus semilaevis]